MPNKLQLKLTSNSGELLSLVTCHAGRISVFRASSPSDLRPYQRALSGSEAKDNLQVVCDGIDFRPEQHIAIGFGEPSPTVGLTVKEFLTKHGVSELAMNSLLLSIGLEAIISKHCSELSPDQEARLRLIAATTNPEKVIVLNDPFEQIANQWRERAAELLCAFARSRNALIVIPCLTYRPESWLDNQCVDRIEVGQTSQRTIGFGSAGSSANAAMNDLREQLRNDPRFAGQIEGSSSSSKKAPLAIAAAVAAGISSKDLKDSTTTAKGSKLASLSTITGVITGASVLGLVTFYISRPAIERKLTSQKSLPAVQQQVDSGSAKQDAKKPQPDSPPQNTQQPAKGAEPIAALNRPIEPPTGYILDLYPVAIETSILDTFSGNSAVMEQSSQESAAAPQNPAQVKNGNLFSLLERSGQDEPSRNQGARSYPGGELEPEEPEYSQAEEDERRDAIRQRFLEAIREAAERRAQAEQEY
jgi:hypothetical protein